VAEAALERIGILTNRNLIPFDPETPARTSGLRIGTPGAAVRGMDAGEAPELAGLIDGALLDADEGSLGAAVDSLLARFPLAGSA
jgi:glycine hydroxymethyltransferase